MSEITDFYRRPGLTSDLGRHQDLVPGLPASARALGAIVRGLLIHFALLHCALLRATGTPARARCGFAGYFEARRVTRIMRP
jgi:hypothetical protein